jgi:hypothetical protein
MRLALATRRVVAVTAATALVTSGGLVGGALLAPASAQGALSVSPNVANSTGVATFTLSATQFYPSSQDTVTLTHSPALVGQPVITGTVLSNTASCPGGAPVPDGNCGSTLMFTADLTNVAPGSYDLKLTETSVSDPAGLMPTVTSKPGAVSVVSGGVPVITSSKNFPGTTNNAGQLEIAGQYLAKGSTVEFVTGPAGGPYAVDPGLSFTPTVDAAATPNGFASATVLRGTYAYGASFAAGLHYLRVTNAIGQAGISTSTFYQPRTTSVAPSAVQIGQGAVALPFVFTGQGYADSSTVFVTAPTTKFAATDVQLAANPTTTPDHTTLSAALSATAAATTGTRTLRVLGPDGGYFDNTPGLTVAVSPKATSVAPTSRGRGFEGDVTVTGTGFTGATAFDFGPGVVATTKAGATATSATVTLTIAQDSPLGTHTVTPRNADGGTTTLSGGFSVNAAPLITSLTPQSAGRGQTVTVDLTGTGFVSGTVVSGDGTGLSVGTTSFASGTHVQAPVTASGSAAFGPHDLTVTNPDGGTSKLVGGFGVNSLTVFTTPVGNSTSSDIDIAGDGLDLSTPVSIILPGNTDQGGAIAGVNKAYNAGTGKLTVTFPLTKKAAGAYTVTATPAGGALTCTGCLVVGASADPAGIALSPAVGGRGAVNRAITVTGTGLSYGQTVTFGPGVTTNSTTYVPAAGATPDSLLVSINIDPAAALGVRDVVVSNVGQPSSNGTKTGGFTVNAAPTVTAISPSALGQGAPGIDVTVTGTLLVAGATVSFGPDITTVTKAGGSATSFLATTTVADTAATTVRTATVTNPDGGVGTLPSALTITPAPRVTSLSPSSGFPGTTLTHVAFVGSGFLTSSAPTLVINGVTPSNVVVTDATHLTADLAIASNAVLGVKDVLVKNADKGQSTLPGAFTIATVPVAPTSVAVTPGDKTATITWSFPTAAGSDGGSALTSFVVDDGSSATNNAVTVTADKRTATLTGLADGTTYTFTVRATNSVGTGPAGTATGTPFGTPLAPTSVSGTPGEGQVLVSWVGANAQGSGITQYTVTSSPAVTPVVVNGSVRSTYVTGLTNGTAYTFTVTAKNAAGSGPASAASAPVTPKISTSMTGVHYPSAITTSGTTIQFAGTLTRTSSRAAIAGATVVLSLRPDVGATRTVTLTTNSGGYWSYKAPTTYSTLVNARYAGSSTLAAVSSAAYKVSVATRITITSPASGGTTGRTTALVIKGATSPNKSGRTVVLYRVVSGGLQNLSTATVQSNGSYTFSVKPGAGDYQLKVGIGGTSGNTGGYSAVLVAHRR